jgi:hypothetical protein
MTVPETRRDPADQPSAAGDAPADVAPTDASAPCDPGATAAPPVARAAPASQPAAAPDPPRAPRRRRRFLKYFLGQLVPVTAGILLALLIDGWLELRRQDRLVDQAQTALNAEITDNIRELDNSIPSMDAFVAALHKHMADIDAILATGSDPGGRPSFGMVVPNLSRASWEGAERTGALEFMDYAHVRAFADLYALQEVVIAGQNELLRRFPTLGPVGTLLANSASAQPAELREARKPVAELIVAIGSHRVMVLGLQSRYRRMQCYPETCPPAPGPPAP